VQVQRRRTNKGSLAGYLCAAVGSWGKIFRVVNTVKEAQNFHVVVTVNEAVGDTLRAWLGAGSTR
jgi:hypothetical protein